MKTFASSMLMLACIMHLLHRLHARLQCEPRVHVQVGRDPRDVMRAAYGAFQEGSKPDRILQAADPRRPSDAFYANLVSHLLLSIQAMASDDLYSLVLHNQAEYRSSSTMQQPAPVILTFMLSFEQASEHVHSYRLTASVCKWSTLIVQMRSQYCGLFLEAEGDQAASIAAIRTALQTPYAQQSGDYMVAVASVHAQSRGATSAGA